jgi:hypothetical protein
MQRIGTLLLALFLGVVWAPRSGAAVYVSNGTPQNIQNIHDAQAQNGDTITLPAGIFIWTSGVILTKAITLQGAGIGATIIRDSVQGSQIISWTLPNVPSNSRLTGIEFQDAGGTHSAAPAGAFHVDGSNTSGATFRWDNCYWNNVNGAPVLNTVLGVIDHDTFYQTRGNDIIIYFYGTRWNGGAFGDGAWAAPANFGSSLFTFVEDCTFTFDFQGHGTVTDAYAGARFVIRHSTINSGTINNHGTESTGRTRGARAYELYNNSFVGGGWNKYVAGSRSGSMVIHDNTIRGYWGISATFSCGNYRTHMTFVPWGGADGTNPWDDNYSTTYYRGAAAATNSCCAVTSSGGPNWATNQWTGYSIKRTTNHGNLNTVTYALIESNTGNTITYSNNGGYTLPSLTFTAGDTFEIHRIRNVLDGIGRGQGSLLSGDPPPIPYGWNNQVYEPAYCWNNVITDAGNALCTWQPGSYDPSIHLNEHIYNNVQMPGYRPYIYPHPLVTGSPPPPTPTPTATATVTATPTATITPTPTRTPRPRPTSTFTPTATARPHQWPIP